MSYVARLTKAGKIKSNDRKALREFSDELHICANALYGTGFLNEINSSDNLRRIIKRLPDWAIKKWYGHVDMLRRSQGTVPGISHICEFVDRQARIMNDPVFGGLLDETDKTDQKRRKDNNNNTGLTGLAGSCDQESGRTPPPGTSPPGTPPPGTPLPGSPNPRPPGGPPGNPPQSGTRPQPCPKCAEGHSLFMCSKFKEMSVKDRKRFVFEKRLCFRCLRSGHIAENCIRKEVCGIDQCTDLHARFLHERPNTRTSTSTTGSDPTQTPLHQDPTQDAPPFDSSNSVNTWNIISSPPPPSDVKGAGSDSKASLLPILPVHITSPNGGSVDCYALLDYGSDTTFILDSMLEVLDPPTRNETFSMNTLGGTVTRNGKVTDSLIISDIEQTKSFPVTNVHSQPEMRIRRNDVGVAKVLSTYSHLKDVHTDYLDCKDVKLVLGAWDSDLLFPKQVKKGRTGTPFAIRTKLGWAVIGRVNSPDLQESNSNFCENCDLDSTRLEDQLATYFRADFENVYNPSKEMSIADKAAQDIMKDSIRLVDGHYEMKLPWKNGCPNFPNNEVMARRRLESLKRKLSANPLVHQRYTETMESYISDSYAEKVPTFELAKLKNESSRFWLLVHFAVYHPLKPDKTRVVFDCPAKYRGTSLNEQLLQGPDHNNSMLGVILRFREGLLAATGDVSAMFHQVKVHPMDCDSLCFLWWPNGNLQLEPEVYRMRVFVFGAICSPSASVFALQQCARDNPQYSQSTLDTIHQGFYVDDCLMCSDDVESMKSRISELCSALQKGGFRLTKWQSTDKDVLESIPEIERAPWKPVNLSGYPDSESASLTRALGIWWDVERDIFLFVSNLDDKPANRRCILSSICKTFDPTGCISPFVLPAKVILQELSRLQLDWDEPAPPEYADKWLEWKSSLPLIQTIELPRCYKLPGNVLHQGLHHFSDAAMVGYGIVTYLRTAYDDGTFNVSFVIGKSRVSPLLSITIPRLELTAAALAARIDITVRHELTIPLVTSVFWTDSISTLGYIKNQNARYHTFVANRISRIHEASRPSQWRYVSTKENPADLASRGINPKDEEQVSMWIHGPKFLSLPEDSWPVVDHEVSSQTTLSTPEVQPEDVLHANASSEDPVPNDKPVEPVSSCLQPLIDYHSNWTRLKRSVAALLRVHDAFLHRVRKMPEIDLRTPLTPKDLIQAEHEIIKQVQSQYFPEEIAILRCQPVSATNTWTLKRRSNIRKFNPILKDGIIRVGGRLNHAVLDYDSKHPVIMPANHSVTDMIIRHFHDLSGHSGREHVLSLTRQRYWIISGNSAVRRVLSRCFDCKRRTAPPCQQRMADLPEDRVTPDHPPFTHTGIDYFGPFYVRVKRSTVKRYGCIFTCLASRAVHIEIAHSLDTDSFLNAYFRFVARRGRPSVIRSDNGSNFRCGQKEISAALKTWNQNVITNKLAQNHVKWIFNVPAASNWGGCWERLIRSIRNVLSGLTRDQVLSEEGSQTLMCQVEEILNSRPLTPVSADPRDLRALTPNDALQCRPGSTLPPGIFSSDDNYVRRRWRQVQYLADVFWRRWTSEYLRTLQTRQKWDSQQRNIQKHDIVVVRDDRFPRNCWPLGRVIEVFKGQDNLVRACKIRTTDCVTIRPITKLCLVENADRDE